jgi:hypothetical protein
MHQAPKQPPPVCVGSADPFDGPNPTVVKDCDRSAAVRRCAMRMGGDVARASTSHQRQPGTRKSRHRGWAEPSTHPIVTQRRLVWSHRSSKASVRISDQRSRSDGGRPPCALAHSPAPVRFGKGPVTNPRAARRRSRPMPGQDRRSVSNPSRGHDRPESDRSRPAPPPTLDRLQEHR